MNDDKMASFRSALDQATAFLREFGALAGTTRSVLIEQDVSVEAADVAAADLYVSIAEWLVKGAHR